MAETDVMTELDWAMHLWEGHGIQTQAVAGQEVRKVTTQNLPCSGWVGVPSSMHGIIHGEHLGGIGHEHGE